MPIPPRDRAEYTKRLQELLYHIADSGDGANFDSPNTLGALERLAGKGNEEALALWKYFIENIKPIGNKK